MAPAIKVYWDAATCTRNQKMRIGVVVRDHVEAFLARLSASLACFPHPLITEFQAMWRVMEFYVELEIDSAQFKGMHKS